MLTGEKLTDAQIADGMSWLFGWQLKDGRIVKLYKFKGFVEAMEFAHRVATLAAEADHHPDILIQYSKVTLTLSTHSAGGLTDKDFDLAKRIDAAEKPAG